ncbi:hypothetical protein G1H11_09705 [Phytoactinopolyspora alkaliphila]|uniref:Uncharacterized protein n=1 Tax=Phytoactinopolyspora alkaliphila TaxID=1783498 RepID=A0A6N9YKL9_9ACTN|nr:hypothetical protein [Phytoactinopolyspora alkaliphila]NED95586.1 hypothetical protein [Phytoactinopolyspora alkaliphila]
MMQGTEPANPNTDPMVSDAVKAVRDRFGAVGLRGLIALATSELARVEKAEAQLATIENAGHVAEPAQQPIDAADTQAWLAYTEADPE